VQHHVKLHEDELVPACGDQDNYNIQKIRGIVNITQILRLNYVRNVVIGIE